MSLMGVTLSQATLYRKEKGSQTHADRPPRRKVDLRGQSLPPGRVWPCDTRRKGRSPDTSLAHIHSIFSAGGSENRTSNGCGCETIKCPVSCTQIQFFITHHKIRVLRRCTSSSTSAWSAADVLWCERTWRRSAGRKPSGHWQGRVQARCLHGEDPQGVFTERALQAGGEDEKRFEGGKDSRILNTYVCAHVFVHSYVHVYSFSEGLSLVPGPIFGSGNEATILHTEIKVNPILMSVHIRMLLSVKYSEISSRKITSLELISNL